MGRVLSKKGKFSQAQEIFERVISDFGPLREPHGFRLQDLARLSLAEITQQRNPGRARQELELFANELLASTWVIGSGGESAICNRVLEALDRRRLREPRAEEF